MSERVFSFRNQHREKGRKFQYALIFFVLRLENKCDDLTPIFSCLHMNMQKRRRAQKNNKAVYTATPVAGGWAGAVMSWEGAVMTLAGVLTSMNYTYLNFSTFKQLKNAKEAKSHRTDRPTDRQTVLCSDL